MIKLLFIVWEKLTSQLNLSKLEKNLLTSIIFKKCYYKISNTERAKKKGKINRDYYSWSFCCHY